MAEPERLGEIISGRNFRFPAVKGRKLEILRINWRGIAGGPESEHSSPTKLSRQTLTVAADGPSWAAELSIKTAELLNGIEAVLGEGAVQKIKIQARPAGGPQGKKGEKRPQKEDYSANGSGVKLTSEVEGELKSIENQKTRDALERMLKKSRASKQSEPGAR